MKIAIETCNTGEIERKAEVTIDSAELRAIHLHLAFPEERNRTGRYMRRHPIAGEKAFDPNCSRRSEEEPPKLAIAEHVREMRKAGLLPQPTDGSDADGAYCVEPTMLAVPVSDVVANLMRPCYHRRGLGGHRLFFFDDEPIDEMTYWCLCYCEKGEGGPRLQFREVRFDVRGDRVSDLAGDDLDREGLVWAATLVPLVHEGKPFPAVEIARRDYDLRQVAGRQAVEAMEEVYAGWHEQWDARVADIVERIEPDKTPEASVFYHSVIGLDAGGCIRVRQVEGHLPALARELARDGFVSAGVLDSGGSCAIYDVWLGCYLNHGWYYREPRGAIILFELNTSQRLPVREGSWIHERRGRRTC